MSYHQGPGPIPNRWLYCPRNADTFIADKFLPFKTPLSARFTPKMPKECQFPPEMVFSFMKMFKVKLGLWVDLTNTNRFYDRKEIEARDCQYTKLQCRGHGEAPSPEQTQSFIEIVNTFIIDHPLEIVGVHCTHGFNRTGFLIVSFMVEKMDCSVEAALMAFAQARPPGIYKADYIKELFRRYEDEEDALPAPELPDWCFEYDDEDRYSAPKTHNNKRSHNHNNMESKRHRSDSPISSSLVESNAAEKDDVVHTSEELGESSSTSTEPVKKKKRKEFLNMNATFMAGVPGVALVTDQPRLGELQATVQKMCKWESNGFPGCQPVSMDLKNIKFLQNQPYHVSWKADGTRYMMLILKEYEVYFFDRDNSCFQVTGLKFPYRKDLSVHIKNTLLDGEMVIDKVNGLSIPRYLVYDVIQFEGEEIYKCSFTERLRCINIDITDPRHQAMKRGLIDKNQEPFSVRPKSFWDITQARALLGPKFAKNLSHEPDGLIFQPSKKPYVPGPCDEVLKWKPIHMNSVDFKLKIAEESGMGILSRKIGYLYVGQLDAPFANIKHTKFLKGLDGKIIECKYENNSWVFMRERTDKSFPNSYNTAMAVWNSIKYPVTTEILLDFIDRHKYDETMPPPAPPKRR